MDPSQQQQPPSGVPGPTRRRLHIAHRRSPSEMTPMIMEQLALQQQIELLQQQQQQIAATHQQYVNMGMIPQQQQLPGLVLPDQQKQGQMGNISTFQFPPQMQQQTQQPQQHGGMGGLQQSIHRRNHSAMPNMGNLNLSGGPPPAPSAGAAGVGLEYTGNQQHQQQQQQHQQQQQLQGHGSQRGGRGGGHQRRHSLALPEAKKAAELAQSKRTPSGFQFPVPSAGGSSPGGKAESLAEGDGLSPLGGLGGSGSLQSRAGNRLMTGHGRSQSMAVGRGMAQGRGGSFQFPPPMATNDAGASGAQRGGHGRSASRNFDGNWRQPQGDQGDGQGQQPMGSFASNVNPQAPSFQPGHRTRPSMNQSISGIGAFQFPGQQMMMPQQQQQQMIQVQQMFAGQQLNPLQLQQLQALQAAGLSPQQIFGNLTPGQQQGGLAAPGGQQQRKTLFTPYLPQASLPALLGDGQLVQGILRVNKKNRSDAYVTCPELDADIFICGSKDRNRALEGDLVAVELLDVDEVWSQKKEKEEKKKRKDIADTRGGGLDKSNSDAGHGGADGGLRRRGSLRQRPTQKKNDDVEVEGQSLLLMEEEEINDEQKPLYAGHVVAVIERIAGQMFSGTLGLLRPSSQATKEKQEAERAQRDGSTGRHSQERHQDKPKIVWFKPTDKRVPLIAIPTEQAPRDFVERHQEYANRIFVACIKRWPITSLHPFGTLVEQLGEMGDIKVETNALLRDNNFGPDEFTDAVLRNIGFDDWSVAKESEEVLAGRRDFRLETVFSLDPNDSETLDTALHIKELGNGLVEIGVHVADAAHFIKANSLVDREAKKRGTGVFLMTHTVNMLPPRLAHDICALVPQQDRYAVSIVFEVDTKTGKIAEDKSWIGKSIVKSSGKLSYKQIDSIVEGKASEAKLEASVAGKDVEALRNIAQVLRRARFGVETEGIPSLRLLYQLDDENVPVEDNIFNSTPAHIIAEELSYMANSLVAQKIAAALPEKALLRRHATPKPGRLQTFAERMTLAGYTIDTSSSGALQNSLFKIKDVGMRQGMETLLVKTMARAKYVVPSGLTPDQIPHFALNLPAYTHFTNPSRRYADIVVHRQLEAVLNGAEGGQVDFGEDIDALNKLVEQCNTKKDSARAAQEQSVHIEACRAIDKKRVQLGADLITEGIVICVYESAFDVLIPEFGFEKRVHCDQLPLHKAEYRKEARVLELYWEKGVKSSDYVPEDERAKATGGGRRYGNHQSAADARAADEAHRRVDTGHINADDVDALFDDDEDAASEATEMTSGVSLNTQSVPQSPRRNSQDGLPRTQSEVVIRDGKTAENSADVKNKYSEWFKKREVDGQHIQDVTEMSRVPIILKTDLTKSPPCLTIRSVNPYAL